MAGGQISSSGYRSQARGSSQKKAEPANCQCDDEEDCRKHKQPQDFQQGERFNRGVRVPIPLPEVPGRRLPPPLDNFRNPLLMRSQDPVTPIGVRVGLIQLLDGFSEPLFPSLGFAVWHVSQVP
jgi:hypothetical protein